MTTDEAQQDDRTALAMIFARVDDYPEEQPHPHYFGVADAILGAGFSRQGASSEGNPAMAAGRRTVINTTSWDTDAPPEEVLDIMFGAKERLRRALGEAEARAEAAEKRVADALEWFGPRITHLSAGDQDLRIAARLELSGSPEAFLKGILSALSADD